MPYDVFISHSSIDKPVADAAVAVLERSRIRCWVAPRDILPGSDWGAAIIQGIRASRLMLVIFSSHSNASEQVKREVERAVHQGIPIIPLRIENIQPTGSMELFLSTPHWLDALSLPMEAHLEQLARTVYLILYGPDQAPPPAPPPAPGPQWPPATGTSTIPFQSPASARFPPWLIAVVAGGLLAFVGVVYLARGFLFGPSVPKVAAMRFFEAGAYHPIPKERRAYAARFATIGTRYIEWEVDLDAPVSTVDSTLELDAKWYKPDGLLETTQHHSVLIQKGTVNPYFSNGWGTKDGGYFHPGTYRVELYLGGRKWTEAKFEVYDGEAPPSGYVDQIDGVVTSLNFFETPAGTMPKEQRRYRKIFSRTSRYISWELNLSYPKVTTLTPFTVHQVWRKPSGEIETEQDVIVSIQPGWTYSYHDWSWGTARGGYWQPGTYRVDLYVDKRRIVSGSYDVED
jgi:hypothetical protein